MCSGPKVGSYLRRIDSCITQLKAHRPYRACDEGKEEGKEADLGHEVGQCSVFSVHDARFRDQCSVSIFQLL